jgi:hypothetical protein
MMSGDAEAERQIGFYPGALSCAARKRGEVLPFQLGAFASVELFQPAAEQGQRNSWV